MQIIRQLSDSRWEDYKHLKLEALDKEPLAFVPGKEVYDDFSDEEWREELRRVSGGSHRLFFAANEADQLIGMCGLRLYSQPFYTHNAAIQSLYVTPSERGRGFGKTLLETLIELSAEHLIENIFADIISSQKASVSLHETVGFEIVGTVKNIVKYQGKYFDNCVMQKCVS